MKKLYFEVKLLSDIIINQKAATEGPNATLDYIPGSNFLGIVAGELYSRPDKDNLKKDILEIIHSGNVHFGDAHLGHNNSRCNKVPAAMFYPKLKKATETLYISHLIPDDKETKKKMSQEQLKQCRSGFYDFTDNYEAVKTDLSFAIKSAHDKETRTSKKSQLFGYQSINSDQVLYFEVECDEKYEDLIKKALTNGNKRVGRSRSSQYGLVKITCLDKPYKEVPSVSKKGQVTVYADSRLVFIDNNTGLPTFRPTPEQLGLTGGKIVWEKSQIRTFQYAPWNFQRQCFDTDRCGMEKGSVIVVEGVEDCPSESTYVGSYKNEGFGRVIYNPSFLEGDPKTGMALKTLKEPNQVIDDKEPEIKLYTSDSPLMIYLKERHFDEADEQFIYEEVNEWVDKNANLFVGKSAFASQWGTIRTIATQYNTTEEIINQLFKKVKVKVVTKRKPDGSFKEETETKPDAYLTHGVASEKWGRDRLNAFRDFCSYMEESVNDKFFRMAIINLAAEMAKRCRKEDSK